MDGTSILLRASAISLTGMLIHLSSASAAPPPPCIGECMNVFLPKPNVAAGALTVVFAGDVRSQIDLLSTQGSATVNPFAYVDENLFGASSTTSTVSATLNAQGNTELTFTAGLHPILNTYSFQYGPAQNGMPHYGYQGFGNLSAQVLAQFWSEAAGSPALPTLAAHCPAAQGPASAYAVLFAEFALNGQVSGQWLECPVDSGAGRWTLSNPTAGDETVSQLGYYLSATPIPLELLNFNGLPPPDISGSPFLSLAALDGTILAPGDSLTLQVPEPGSQALLALGLLGLLAGLRGRRNA